ncbi:MAG: hypothetical protein L0287_32170, partial [Anaerolineae bacterium]|nr:hypothetical protein [Anaerolineae bacterium]
EMSEPYSLELFMSTIREIDEQCRKENLNKVLVDLRKMEGDPSILDRYQIGVEIANVWGPRYRVAGVAKAEMINKMIENTAVNRGARLLATSDIELAMEWLGIGKYSGEKI